eukprot:13113405-Alexandrium_andersonii.AAC.1
MVHSSSCSAASSEPKSAAPGWRNRWSPGLLPGGTSTRSRPSSLGGEVRAPSMLAEWRASAAAVARRSRDAHGLSCNGQGPRCLPARVCQAAVSLS